MNQEIFEKLLMQTFVFNGKVWKQSHNLRKEKYVVITRVFSRSWSYDTLLCWK